MVACYVSKISFESIFNPVNTPDCTTPVFFDLQNPEYSPLFQAEYFYNFFIRKYQPIFRHTTFSVNFLLLDRIAKGRGWRDYTKTDLVFGKTENQIGFSIITFLSCIKCFVQYFKVVFIDLSCM